MRTREKLTFGNSSQIIFIIIVTNIIVIIIIVVVVVVIIITTIAFSLMFPFSVLNFRIRHFPIELTPSGRYVIGKHAFDGLTEIVTFYKTHALFYTQNKEAITLGESFRGM